MTRAIPFDRRAVQRIHEIARGVPRRINLLCDRAMLGAYAHGRHVVDSPMVEKAGREVFGRMPNSTPPEGRPVVQRAGLGLVIGAGLAGAAIAAFALYGSWRAAGAPAALAVASAASTAASGARPSEVTATNGATNAATTPAAASAVAASAAGRPAAPGRPGAAAASNVPH